MARMSAASCGSFSFAPLPAARGEVLQAAHAVLLLVQSLLDRLASPAEAVLGLAGAAAAQCRGHLGLEQAALVSGQPPGPRPNQGVVLLDGVFHHSGPARGETVTEPRSAHHPGGQDSSVLGRFPSSGRLINPLDWELANPNRYEPGGRSVRPSCGTSIHRRVPKRGNPAISGN